jgi:hypothetical protein
MIWMGVARPKDFVAILNRFPPHYQRLTDALKRLFVAKSIGKSTGFYLLACSSLPTGAVFGMIWPVAGSGYNRQDRVICNMTIAPWEGLRSLK